MKKITQKIKLSQSLLGFVLSFCCLFQLSQIEITAQICASNGCSFAQSFDVTDISFSVIGSSQLDLSTNVDYVAMEGADPPSNCGATYINGYDQLAGGTSIQMTLNTPIAVDPAVTPSIDYCFFFYNDSNLTGAEPVAYGNFPFNITLTTDAGNVSTPYSFTPAELVALEAGEWIFICATFNLPGGATQIEQIEQVMEFEISTDGRCEVGAGGYSPGNTCEVFGIAPDGITTCPVEIVEEECEEDPSFACPSNLDKCDDVFDLAPVDASGTWSGSGAIYVDASTNEFDPSTCPIGVNLTLTYTVGAGTSCETSESCTFQIFDDCDADGGKF